MAHRNKTPEKSNHASEEYILPQEGFVRQPVVLKILGIGRSTLWRRIEEGVYPRPVKLSPRVSAWRVKDIRALISKFDAPENEGGETSPPN